MNTEWAQVDSFHPPRPLLGRSVGSGKRERDIRRKDERRACTWVREDERQEGKRGSEAAGEGRKAGT